MITTAATINSKEKTGVKKKKNTGRYKPQRNKIVSWMQHSVFTAKIQTGLNTLVKC